MPEPEITRGKESIHRSSRPEPNLYTTMVTFNAQPLPPLQLT